MGVELHLVEVGLQLVEEQLQLVGEGLQLGEGTFQATSCEEVEILHKQSFLKQTEHEMYLLVGMEAVLLLLGH